MKPLKYLFISSMLFVATSCGNSWLDLEPSTSVDTETSIKILSDVEFTLNGISAQCRVRTLTPDAWYIMEM